MWSYTLLGTGEERRRGGGEEEQHFERGLDDAENKDEIKLPCEQYIFSPQLVAPASLGSIS